MSSLSLLDLPLDVQQLVLSAVGWRSLSAVARTCRALAAVVASDALYKQMALDDQRAVNYADAAAMTRARFAELVTSARFLRAPDVVEHPHRPHGDAVTNMARILRSPTAAEPSALVLSVGDDNAMRVWDTLRGTLATTSISSSAYFCTADTGSLDMFLVSDRGLMAYDRRSAVPNDAAAADAAAASPGEMTLLWHAETHDHASIWQTDRVGNREDLMVAMDGDGKLFLMSYSRSNCDIVSRYLCHDADSGVNDNGFCVACADSVAFTGQFIVPVTPTGLEKHTHVLDVKTTACALDRHGLTVFASGTEEGTLHLCDPRVPVSEWIELDYKHDDWVYSLAFRDSALIAGMDNGVGKVFDVRQRLPVADFRWQCGEERAGTTYVVDVDWARSLMLVASNNVCFFATFEGGAAPRHA